MLSQASCPGLTGPRSMSALLKMEPDPPELPAAVSASESTITALGSEQPAAKWAKRTDAPTTRFSRGAQKWSGGRISEEDKRAAMDSLLSDMEAASAKGPNAALLRTWQLSAPEPIVRGGPVGAWNLAVLGVFFLLREIEASLSLASSVTLNSVTKVVSWLLPWSKTDSAALTTTRERRCVCDANTIWLCPFHAAIRQMKFLKDTFGDESGTLPPGLPFFPSLKGEAVTKESVVKTIKEWHRRAGLSVVDADGSELLGGHSLRTGGAVLLASEGVHIYQIELMARWKSAMLIHYAKTAPLKKMSRDYVRNKVQQELHDRLMNWLELLRTSRTRALRGGPPSSSAQSSSLKG